MPKFGVAWIEQGNKYRDGMGIYPLTFSTLEEAENHAKNLMAKRVNNMIRYTAVNLETYYAPTDRY